MEFGNAFVGRRDLMLGGAAMTGMAALSGEVRSQVANGDSAANYMADPGINEPVPAQPDLAALSRMQHEFAIAKLPHIYAQSLDRADIPALDRLFTADAEIIVRGGVRWDRARIMDIPNVLRAGYRGTFHAVFNQTQVVNGRTAVGEVYTIARHFRPVKDGHWYANDMTLRYEDKYRLGDDNRWRFSMRRIILVASEPFSEIAPPV